MRPVILLLLSVIVFAVTACENPNGPEPLPGAPIPYWEEAEIVDVRIYAMGGKHTWHTEEAGRVNLISTNDEVRLTFTTKPPINCGHFDGDRFAINYGGSIVWSLPVDSVITEVFRFTPPDTGNVIIDLGTTNEDREYYPKVNYKRGARIVLRPL